MLAESKLVWIKKPQSTPSKNTLESRMRAKSKKVEHSATLSEPLSRQPIGFLSQPNCLISTTPGWVANKSVRTSGSLKWTKWVVSRLQRRIPPPCWLFFSARRFSCVSTSSKVRGQRVFIGSRWSSLKQIILVNWPCQYETINSARMFPDDDRLPAASLNHIWLTINTWP